MATLHAKRMPAAWKSSASPCEEVRPEDVDTIILTALKHRNYSKGALAYLAVLMNPAIVAGAKHGGDRKSRATKCLLIEDATLEPRIADFAKHAGVSASTMKEAIWLYKFFEEHTAQRISCEPGIWVGNSLDSVKAGALAYGVGKKDRKETAAEKAERIAAEDAEKAATRFMQIEVSMRKWETLLPEGKTMVIEKALRMLTSTPDDFRQAILTGLQS